MKGTCLCGAVRYEVIGTPTAFDLCHCSRCREASGSAFIAELVFEAAEIEWVSPLRTDSRQPVSKICWCVKTFGEMMNVPKRLEPTGFFSFAPACAGRFGRMRIGGSSKIARTAEGCVRPFTCLVPAWAMVWYGSSTWIRQD